MIKRIAALLALLMIGLIGLSACGTARAYSSQCAFIIGDGVGDNRDVKKVVYPGTRFSVGDDIVRFVPCNARNFIIANRENNRDRTNPVEAKTAATETKPATRVQVYLSTFWALNQKESVLKEFVPFCEKYNCYASESKVSGSDNYSTPGWNGMLGENFSPAIDRAVATAMTKFPPNVWEDRSQWTKVADAIQQEIQKELRVATGSKNDFFCSSGSDTREGEKCDPPRFVIDHMEPADKRLIQQQQDVAAATGQKTVDTERRAAAEKLYGNLAGYYLGLQDTIAACQKAGQNCTVIVGNGGGVNVIPTK